LDVKSEGMMEYNEECRSIVAFAVSNYTTSDGFIYCPCKLCRNNLRHPPDYVLAHLTWGKGMIPSYIFWYMHGETTTRGPAACSYSCRLAEDAADGSTEQGGDMHAMLRDAFNMYEVREDNCEPHVVVQGG
jgi:hypothetical protein